MTLICQFAHIMFFEYLITFFDIIISERSVIMASKEQLRKIALYCNEYDPSRNNLVSSSLTSSVRAYEDKYENCINCIHYTKEGKCNLNLIDQILSSLSMELDLKS